VACPQSGQPAAIFFPLGHSTLCTNVVTYKRWNLSAMASLIELKLGGDLELVSQISVHVLLLFWFQDSIVLHFVNKQTKKQTKMPKS
jgi:hypothetical protein